MKSKARADLERELSRETLASLAEVLMPGSEMLPVHGYDGGVRCTVRAVDVVSSSGDRLEIVVKMFPAEFLEEDPGAFERESRVLELLGSTDVPAPRLVHADAGGLVTGAPTLVMTRLPGIPLMRVQARQPASDSSWVRPVVHALAQIHRVSVETEDLARLPAMDSGSLERELRAMPESDIQHRLHSLPWANDIWSALQRHSASGIREAHVLVHGDFHAGNLLWHSSRLSGVIDWADAGVGAAGRDLAHLRWETVLRYDLDVLDLVQHAYQDEVGRSMPNTPIWDLLFVWKLGDAIRSWIWFFELEGRGAVTLEQLERRRLLFVEHALNTLS